ncbi:unnamed protein product, partial [Prunus brigantina]
CAASGSSSSANPFDALGNAFIGSSSKTFLLSHNFIQTLMATCCTRFERRLTRMSLRRTKRPFQGQTNHIGMIQFDYRRNSKLVEQFLCDFVINLNMSTDNEPFMRALSKLVNLNNPDLVLFVGEALVGNDIVDQLSKFNQLLDEMIDNGFPLTTEPNILREMIAPPNIVNKMLSVVTGNSSNMSDTVPGATSSFIPWRTTDPKYANNEAYVDLVEEMDAIVNSCVCAAQEWGRGEVQGNSHLSGVPDLTFSFANPSILDDKFLFLDSFVMQIVIDSCCATFAEVQKRGKDFWAEFELYAADLLVGIVVNIALVGMLAPYARIGKPSV